MFVPCPHCGFLVALIVTRGGEAVRCPRCAESLDAEVAHAAAAAPAAAEQEPEPAPHTVGATTGPRAAAVPAEGDTGHARSGATDTGRESDSRPATTLPVGDLAAGHSAITAAEPGVHTEHDVPATGRPHAVPRQPSFLRSLSTPAHPNGPRWSGIIAVSGLAALLALQLLLSQRTELAANERWRPVIASACSVLGCEVPLWHQPAAYTMLARDVQPASSRPGVLQVKASFRNDARWPQAWPALQLQLTDVNGQAVAARVLQPADYHSDDEAPTPLAPGQSASVEFQVAEPATPIVAFNFDFR